MCDNNITNILNTIYLLIFMQTFYKSVLRALCLLTLLVSCNVNAQTIYGIGAVNNTLTGTGAFVNLFNRFYIVNPTTGLASTPTVPNSLPAGVTESVAIAVSPINGLVYWVERIVATPRIGTWNPSTGATTIIGNAATPVTTPPAAAIDNFLRATFCPNGSFYIAGNGAAGAAGAEIYQINPTTLALVRTVVATNIPTSGSGDVVCTSNGDLYIVARSTDINIGTPYQLFRISAAQLTVAGDISIAASFQNNISTPNTQAFNGLSEAPNGSLIASVAAIQTATYSINTSTAVATTLSTVVGAALGDLSREFPRDVSIQKSVTPTTALQGTTITYTLTIRNTGPAVAGNISVVDPLPTTGINIASTTWACTIITPGTTTAVTSACATPTGTGAVSTTVSLSIGGTAQIVISAPAQSSFFGTLSNTATASVVSNTLDNNTANNIATTTSTITPATNLGVTKTDGTLTAVAGSTNSYTVTFTNSGPGNGAGSVVKDIPATGLANCSVTACTGTGSPTAAVCPIPLSDLLSVTGSTVATFPANTSLIYTVQCGVTATGQ